MIIIFFLIPLSILIGAIFLGSFVWAVKTGQYEDTCTPAMRLLTEDSGAKLPTETPVPDPPISGQTKATRA